MATTNAGTDGANQPTHFVVELQTEQGVRYAICEQLMLAGEGNDSLPIAVLQDFLNRNPLRAAAIPGGSSGALTAAMVGQSGHDPE